MPFFSVIIPLFNKERYIKHAVNSVFAQTFDDFELIVVDDGSSDQGMEKVEAILDPRIKLYAQKNSGASAARNFGVEKALGEHIALLDADDVWEKNHLTEFYRSIQKFPDAALYCNAYRIILPGGFSHRAIYNLPQKNEIVPVVDYFKASIVHPLANSNSVMFKKKDFIEIGGFDPYIFCSEDIDLWIRFALYKKVVFNPVVTNSYDKTIEKSLSKQNHRTGEHELFNSYEKEEDSNPSLKKYLDLNRYSLAIQCKYFDDRVILDKLKNEISPASLNVKQKFLLNCPPFIVRKLRDLYLFLLKRKIYVTTFK